ncbi:tyrosine-type recombinase/integrase [Candidatus Palauibacter sp.]|uniref:tyrosine-type recombinase/integrase n=1 Tax=Candidatus Palauibacter sp. TaxID=3101350 RepID=UPI003B58E0AB
MFANRKLAREGGDPLSEKRRVESTPTFADAVRQVWKQLRPGWRSPEHAQLWLSSLERYAVPRIGKMPISEVTSADVIGILAPIWHDMPPTARKLRQRIRAVMEWAVAMDLRPDNPCDRIGPVLGSQGNGVRHMRAFPHGEVSSAIETVQASNARPVVKLAFEFLVLTATRSGEVRGALWTEIDRDEGAWIIPAPRTKGNREHRVPLCGRALEILEEARALGRGSPLVFSGRARKAHGEHGVVGAAQGGRDRSCATRVPVEFPRLGGRRDGSSPRGRGGGAGTQGP